MYQYNTERLQQTAKSKAKSDNDDDDDRDDGCGDSGINISKSPARTTLLAVGTVLGGSTCAAVLEGFYFRFCFVWNRLSQSGKERYRRRKKGRGLFVPV